MIWLQMVEYLIIGVFIIWAVSLEMVKKERIVLFLPFFIAGVLASFEATVLFYGEREILFPLVIRPIYLVLLIWIFLIIKRENNGNN